jgi:hypothetical protein
MEPLQSVPFYRLFAAILIDLIVFTTLFLLFKRGKSK